jgi:superfamily II DNA helicase RecQ
MQSERVLKRIPDVSKDEPVELICSGRTRQDLPYIEDSFYSLAASRLTDRYGGSKFKSRLQQHAIAASIKGEELLYIAPCGSGKSNIIWMGFKPQMCTVCIVPYRILRTQMADTAESLGFRTLNFCERTKHLFNALNPPDLIVLSYEQITTCSTMLYELGARLQRIILDEIQICFSEEFRLIVGQYKRWRSWLSFNAPITYLSGSFPPSWEEGFQAAFGAPSALVPIVRESVVRDNVLLEFILNDSWTDLFYIIAALSSELQKGKVEKTMVFVMHRRECTIVKDFLMSPSSVHSHRQIYTYWSGQTDEDQVELSRQFEAFKRSAAGIIICTHAGAIGADISGVSTVYHLEGAHSLVSYFQATGRCGRDGSQGKAVFMSNARLIQKSTKDANILELATTKECKRLECRSLSAAIVH